MSRINHCTACNNEKYGVKTRVAVPHTCGKEFDAKRPLHINLKSEKKEIEQLAEGAIIKMQGDSRNEYFIREHYKDKWSRETKIVAIGSKKIRFIPFGTIVLYTGKNFYE